MSEGRTDGCRYVEPLLAAFDILTASFCRKHCLPAEGEDGPTHGRTDGQTDRQTDKETEIE